MYEAVSAKIKVFGNEQCKNIKNLMRLRNNCNFVRFSTKSILSKMLQNWKWGTLPKIVELANHLLTGNLIY